MASLKNYKVFLLMNLNTIVREGRVVFSSSHILHIFLHRKWKLFKSLKADHYQHFRNITMGKVENGLETENRARGGNPIWKLLQQFQGDDGRKFELRVVLLLFCVSSHER